MCTTLVRSLGCFVAIYTPFGWRVVSQQACKHRDMLAENYHSLSLSSLSRVYTKDVSASKNHASDEKKDDVRFKYQSYSNQKQCSSSCNCKTNPFFSSNKLVCSPVWKQFKDAMNSSFFKALGGVRTSFASFATLLANEYNQYKRMYVRGLQFAPDLQNLSTFFFDISLTTSNT